MDKNVLDEYDFMSPEIKICALLKIIHNSVRKEVNNKMAQIDLTLSQLDVLNYLYGKKGSEVNPSDIEKDLYLSKATVSGILQRCEKKGFISIQPSKTDNRKKVIVLSQKTDEFSKNVQNSITIMLETFFSCLSQTDKENLVTILTKLENRLSEKI